jgi:hypothetical protein
MHALAIAVLLLGGVPEGGKLYIKTPTASMTDKADGSGKKTALRQGDEVTWNGADEKNKAMQAVELKGKRGFVRMTALTPNKPADEVVGADGKTASAAEFAASGAGTRGESGETPVLATSNEEKAAAAKLLLLRASSAAQKAKVLEHLEAQGLGGAP